MEKTVRIFISSTFRDMHAERDHLVTIVFPELRERLERLGLELYDVDLRWGVPEKEKGAVDGEKANSWAYCKQWIERVEPFFISLLGQRYGWIPPDQEIRDEKDRTAYKGLSITEMEIRHAVFSGKLHRRTFFYFRQTIVPESTPPETYREFVDPNDQERLHRLKDEIIATKRPVRSYECRWTGTSFTELETFGQMVLEDLWSGVLRDERFVSKETWRKAIDHDPDDETLYTDESKTIPPEVWEKLVEAAKPAPRDPLEADSAQMAAFAAARLRWFHGRKQELGQLTAFVNDDLPPEASRICVVRAVAGQGKSSLLAKLADQRSIMSHLLITHFVGVGERGSNVYTLLERLDQELERNGIPAPADSGTQNDMESLRKRFAGRLEQYAGERRLVLLIDAVNQLSDGHDLFWLPGELGPSVRIILSSIDDPFAAPESAERQIMSALMVRQPEPMWVNLQALDEEDVHSIVQDYLVEYCKELDTAQVETICQMEQARNPLYLLVMLNELRTLGGNEMNKIVPQLIARMKEQYPDTTSLFDWVLERLEIFGQPAMKLWCTYLALGRIGMSSHELSDLLARKLGTEAARTSLLIERGMRRYLLKRGAQLDFFHGQLRQAVHQRYLLEDATPYHTELAAYLETIWRRPDVHALSELIYHQRQGELWGEMYTRLTDFDFLELRCQAASIYDLESDYHLALQGWQAENKNVVQAFEERLRLDSHTINKAHELLFPQLYNYLTWLDAPAGPIHRLCEQAAKQRHGWLRMTQDPHPAPPAWLRSFEGHTGYIYSVIVTPDGRRVISGSVDNTIKVWKIPAGLNGGVENGDLLFSLEGHTSYVNSLAVSPDGLKLISGSHDKTVKIWDISDSPQVGRASGRLLRSLAGHTEYVESLAVTPDGRQIITGSDDKTLKVWDIESGHLLRSFVGHTGGVFSIAITPDGCQVVSGSSDTTIKVWEIESGCLIRSITGHTKSVNTVAITSDGQRVVSGSRDKTIKIWDLHSGRLLRTIKAHNKGVIDLAVTLDGRKVIARLINLFWASSDKNLEVWSLESGRYLYSLKGHTDEVKTVLALPDNRRVISSSYDMTIKIWNISDSMPAGQESERLLQNIEVRTGATSSLTVTPDGRRIITGSWDMVKVFDFESGHLLLSLRGHTKVVNSIAITPDGRQVVSGSEDKTIKIWDISDYAGTGVKSERLLRSLAGHTKGVTAVAVTPDGRRIVSGSKDKTLKVWDFQSGRLLHSIKGPTGGVIALAITPDGRQAISSSHNDYTPRLWDISDSPIADRKNDRLLRSFKGHSQEVYALATTPDGRRVITGSGDIHFGDGILKVWDIESGACLYTLKGHTDSVVGVAVTRSGHRAVSCSHDHTLKVWDISDSLESDPVNGRLLRSLVGHTQGVTAFAITPDGRRVISSSADDTLKVWDTERENRLRSIEGHIEQVHAVAITPDGKRVVSCTGSWREPTIKVWDLQSGHLSSVLEGSLGDVTAIAITPDGRQMVSGSTDRTLKTWDISHSLSTGLKSGHLLRSLSEAYKYKINALAITSNGCWAISGHWDKVIKVWDLEKGELLRTLEGHKESVNDVAVTPDGNRIISCSGSQRHSNDNTIKVWDVAAVLDADLENGALLRTLEGHTDKVNKIAITPDGRQVVSASDDKTLRVWDISDSRHVDIENGRLLLTLVGHTGEISAVAIAPDNGQVVSCSMDKTLRVWNLECSQSQVLFNNESPLLCLAISPDGHYIACGDEQGHIWIFERVK